MKNAVVFERETNHFSAGKKAEIAFSPLPKIRQLFTLLVWEKRGVLGKEFKSSI